ncbi:phosphogluconate dehydrogenase (NAD(+)-dependent, decarboxylating) [Glycomyces sp. YM15]|uniref:phosphogluconate dehydrogenase (NAD(+)-dependent, decarboxylating) n=1 Tax=Glycomyces sp. YM15 TaxID=2800446 RepID=UPI0019650D16|nr:decarboxylating 6-phosphogluconate dehydrogenase [Glycomyces sp. YM15]
MQLGMIGLGKMGGNMKLRLEKAGHQVVGYDRNPDVADVDSLEALVAALEGPRAIWVMVPAGEPTRSTVAELGALLSEGDIVIDGGNSRFTDDAVNAALLAERGIGYVDAGVSGGVWGITEGYALMVGGADGDVERLMPIFNALKPEGEFGFVHAGGVGAGHYAKMVHNGIEYAMMQAYAEGYELLEASEHVDNVPEIFKSWRSGTVIRSWLLDLMDRALTDDPELARVKGYVEDSGEGRWTVDEGIRLRVPLPAITESLFARFTSRQEDSPAMKAVAALRNQFGGHAVKSE